MSASQTRQRGITLIEQIVLIIVVSVGVIGLVSVMRPMIRNSADPMRTKQIVAIAESLLSEALHQPFTWCDPDDPAASTAQTYGDCAFPQNTLTTVPLGGESRNGGAGATYDNVSDYGGFNMSNATDAAGGISMAGYSVLVNVNRVGIAMGLADDSAALSITVTVTYGTESFALTGYRFRYAPRT